MSTRNDAAGRPPSPRSLFIAALLVLPAAAHAANYWVGNGGQPPCTHANLQDAITTAVGGAGDDVIYLVGPGPFSGPFNVLGGGLRIQGNVGSCGSSTSVGYSTLRAPSGSRPLAILMGGAETVRLQRIVVTTDHGGYNGDGGGIWFAGASNGSVLELVDSQVVSNTAFGEGGGVFVSGGKLVVGLLSLVGDNAAAVNGGGIAARNGARVEVYSWVLGNTALFDGGGVYAPDAAVTVHSAATAASVSNNIAGLDGGGLYLGGGKVDVFTSSGPAFPSTVSGNLAQRGAGLFVDGADVRLRYVSIDHNSASGEGGGIYAQGNSGLFTNASLEPIPLGGFPRLETNSAADGAALYLAGNATAILGSGRLRDHHGGNGVAMVVAAGTGSLLLDGLTVQGNALPALVGVEGSAFVQLLHVSFAGNVLTGIVRWRGSDSIFIISSSALDETEPFFASFEAPSSPPQFVCVVSKSALPFASLPPNSILVDITIADPQFVAAPNDLHLRHTSPAIDVCLTNDRVDLDGDVRAHDDPYHPNGELRTADAGADEATVLFVDGFESGSLVKWNGGHSP